ncbi:MAG: metal ABC transporter substrate-binding protein [Oscillospiraceae bacterium]
MKRLLPLLLSLLLLLPGCSSSAGQDDEAVLHIVATTYPVYLFTNTIVGDTEGVEVTQLVTEETSCLHDYTLTVTDMKAIEKADVLILNGAGLEDFMEDALAQSKAAVIDCSAGIDLLPSAGHEHHDHEDENDHDHFDPHFWLDEKAVLTMMNNIVSGLSALDEVHADSYTANLNHVVGLLSNDSLDTSSLSCPYLITFHNGFQYFARSNGLTLLKAIEEEEGSEASAAEIKEIVALIEEYDIPAIFTEKNGSDATAQAISRETGVAVYQLDMIMSGDGQDISDYVDAMNANYAVIREALS